MFVFEFFFCFNIFIGQYLGTVVSFPLSALLCQYGFDGGWPSVFYVFGKHIQFSIFSKFNYRICSH